MKNKYKVVKHIVVIILTIILAYNIIFHAMLFFTFSPVFMPSKENTEKDLQQYRTELLIVVNYLGNQNNTSIYITDANDTKTTFIKDPKIGIVETNIEDDEVAYAIYHIMYNGKFSVISGNSDQFIEFQRWSTLDKSCGIVYSFNGNQPNTEFLTELMPLKESGWYYYVSDFDEYRRNKQT